MSYYPDIFLSRAQMDFRNISIIHFYRLPFLIKTALVLLMGVVYSLYIQLSHIEIFKCYDDRVNSSIPQHTITLLRIVLFMIAVLTHGRTVEWTARLDFLWQLQASHEKREMAVLQESNRRILFNLLRKLYFWNYLPTVF